MADPTEDEIRTRAFELWKDAGEPNGVMETLLSGRERVVGAASPQANEHRLRSA
jgi:hypothetical protein